ncbi:MAG: hypothetical protein ACREQW_11505 [Candidatus Binatia bacterium]
MAGTANPSDSGWKDCPCEHNIHGFGGCPNRVHRIQKAGRDCRQKDRFQQTRRQEKSHRGHVPTRRIKIRDLPRFPPLWESLSGLSKSGWIGRLRHARVNFANRYLLIVVEEGSEFFFGRYATDLTRLTKLQEALEQNIGEQLSAVADIEIDI